jgi:hypothetical protein
MIGYPCFVSYPEQSTIHKGMGQNRVSVDVNGGVYFIKSLSGNSTPVRIVKVQYMLVRKYKHNNRTKRR